MSYNPENFGDVADLAGLVQRRQNLQELRSLNASLKASHESAKLQTSLQDILFNFKIMTDNIDKLMNAGQLDCLLMIHKVKSQFDQAELSHEMFSSLEYKNLLVYLVDYFSNIHTKARGILGDDLYEKGQKQVEVLINRQRLEKEAADAREQERLKLSEKEKNRYTIIFWIVAASILLIFGIIVANAPNIQR